VSDAAATPRQTQMSPRARKRFLIGLAVFCVSTFFLGMFLYFVDFRHRSVCPGGAQWISRSSDPLGQVTYTCPGGRVVTQSLVP
jgi:hypothetical protein